MVDQVLVDFDTATNNAYHDAITVGRVIDDVRRALVSGAFEDFEIRHSLALDLLDPVGRLSDYAMRLRG